MHLKSLTSIFSPSLAWVFPLIAHLSVAGAPLSAAFAEGIEIETSKVEKTDKVRKNLVKVGVITTLSGGMSTIGTAVRNGVELARADRPQLFSGVEFFYEDDQFDAKRSIAAYQNLKINRKIDLLIGFGTVQAQAIGPLVERDQVPLISINFEAAPVVGKRFIVRSINHTDQYMAALAAYLRKTRGEDDAQFPVIQAEMSFFRAMITSLKKALGADSGVLEVATVSPNEMDFRSVILKLKSQQPSWQRSNLQQPNSQQPRLLPGMLGLFLFPEQLIVFAKQARELGLQASYFGTDLCETAANLTEGGSLIAGCLYPDNDASPEFRARYREKFGNEAQLTFAGSAYDMTILTAEVVNELLKRNRHFSAADFLMALKKVADRPGVLGDFSFKHREYVGNFFEYPVHVKIIEGRRGTVLPH